MWQEVTQTYDVDLSLPGDQRWEQVIAKEAYSAKKVAFAALEDFRKQAWLEPWWRWLRKTFASAYVKHRRPYWDEIGAWSEALGMPYHDLLTLQFSYELQHAAEWICYKLGINRPLTPMGCTAGMIWRDGYGPIHVRSMDWPLPTIGDATRLFRFCHGDHEFVSVGILGLCGVISGMVPGQYSCTINWASPTGLPEFYMPPSYLLRNVMENYDTHWPAICDLQDTRLSTNVLYAFCGKAQGSCRVIERTKQEYAVVCGGMPEHGAVVVANDFTTAKFKKHNLVLKQDPEVYDDCRYRAGRMAELLADKRNSKDVLAMAEVLDEEPICNAGSVQQMLFDVSRGRTHAWAFPSGT